MGDEGEQAPNVEASSSISARAPLDLVWLLFKDRYLLRFDF